MTAAPKIGDPYLTLIIPLRPVPGLVGSAGRVGDGIRNSLHAVPVPCRGILPAGPGKGDGMLRCLGAHGYRTVFSYQPAGRYWALQGIEAAIFLAMAGLLVVVAFRPVARPRRVTVPLPARFRRRVRPRR